MSKSIKIVRYTLIFLVLLLVTCCAPERKNTYYQKRKKAEKASHINTEQLGRNRYFFSPKYQKKLQTSYKKRKVKY
jgi:uncharacterized lipoprotein YmbA